MWPCRRRWPRLSLIHILGFLFQNPDSQICCNTVREELLFGFKALGQAGPEADARVDAIIEEFGFDADDDPFPVSYTHLKREIAYLYHVESFFRIAGWRSKSARAAAGPRNP